MTPPHKKARVAIVMRAKNEMPFAARALDALRRQSFQDFVLYAVDSGSTDGTLQVLQTYQEERGGTLVRIPPEEYFPGPVLNRLIGMTEEDIVVLLNADAIPQDSEWLHALTCPIIHGEADATMSRQIARPGTPFIVAYDYERAYATPSKNRDFFSAVACAFLRELWEEEPFYTKGYSEDLAWSHALQSKGKRFLFVPQAVVEHSHTYTLRELYRRGYIEGEALVYIYRQKPSLCKTLFTTSKAMLRDFLSALRRGQIGSIPYNLAYRCVREIGIYQGLRHGA